MFAYSVWEFDDEMSVAPVFESWYLLWRGTCGGAVMRVYPDPWDEELAVRCCALLTT